MNVVLFSLLIGAVIAVGIVVFLDRDNKSSSSKPK